LLRLAKGGIVVSDMSPNALPLPATGVDVPGFPISNPPLRLKASIGGCR